MDSRDTYKVIKSNYIYNGECKGNIPNGEGVCVYKYKNKYEIYTGRWESGKRNGEGRYIDSDKNIYEGYWINDEMNSKKSFKVKYKNGDEYYGIISNMLRHGIGTLKKKNSDNTYTEYDATWNYGNIECSDVEIRYSDGSVYQGSCNDKLQRDGYGIIKDSIKGSIVYKGNWKKDNKLDIDNNNKIKFAINTNFKYLSEESKELLFDINKQNKNIESITEYEYLINELKYIFEKELNSLILKIRKIKIGSNKINLKDIPRYLNQNSNIIDSILKESIVNSIDVIAKFEITMMDIKLMERESCNLLYRSTASCINNTLIYISIVQEKINSPSGYSIDYEEKNNTILLKQVSDSYPELEKHSIRSIVTAKWLEDVYDEELENWGYLIDPYIIVFETELKKSIELFEYKYPTRLNFNKNNRRKHKYSISNRSKPRHKGRDNKPIEKYTFGDIQDYFKSESNDLTKQLGVAIKEYVLSDCFRKEIRNKQKHDGYIDKIFYYQIMENKDEIIQELCELKSYVYNIVK